MCDGQTTSNKPQTTSVLLGGRSNNIYIYGFRWESHIAEHPSRVTASWVNNIYKIHTCSHLYHSQITCLHHYMVYYIQPDHNNDKNLFMSHMLSQLVLIHQFYKGRRVAMSVWSTKGVENMASSLKKPLNKELGLVNKGSSELKCYVLRRDLNAKRNSKAIQKFNSHL